MSLATIAGYALMLTAPAPQVAAGALAAVRLAGRAATRLAAK